MSVSATKSARHLALLAGSALFLVLATSAANAQNYYYGNPYNQAASYDAQPDGSVEIAVPHYPRERGVLGSPVKNISLSRPVPFGDLDLRTAWGIHELRNRIRFTARDLCQRLDISYPLVTSDSPPCYFTTVRQAMYQADNAIRQARAYDHYRRYGQRGYWNGDNR